MRTVTKAKRRQFELDLYDLLEGGLSGKNVAVTHLRSGPNSKPPRVYVKVWGPDKLDYLRDEHGPIVDGSGNHSITGECAFECWVDVVIPQTDSQGKGTLYEEADLRAEQVEDALKYGGALTPFQNSRLRVDYTEALPTETWIALDETKNEATVWIQGVIKYEQTDR